MIHCFTPNDAHWELISDGDTVELKAGTYHICRPIELNALQGVAIKGDGAVLSGTVEAQLDWHAAGDKLYVAKLRCDTAPDAVVIDGRRFRMARYPHYDQSIRPLGGYAADCLEFAARCARPEGAYLHAMHSHMWGDMHYRITGLDAQGLPLLEGGWQNNRRMGMHNEYRYVENLKEALGADGEYYYDADEGQLYVCSASWPCAKAELVVNPYILRAVDCRELSIEGIRFRDTARTFMAEYEPLGRSDWCIHRGGALYFERCANIGIGGCEFAHLGGNGVFASGDVSNVHIGACEFHSIGASCACFVGRPECLRYSFAEVGAEQPRADLEARGPASADYVRDCSVEDCLMHGFGLYEKQCAGVQISMAARISVKHCTIYDCPRAAINIGENSFGGHVIEHCDVFDTVQETGDHGSFNSWGRDRFWIEEELNPKARMELALKDGCEPTHIRFNRMRCDHGWDIDLDDGSSNYIIESNLCLNGGIKLREGFRRVCRNNIAVNNTIHTHVWYEGSGDVIERNIVFTPYKPIGMKYRWGESVDRNVLYNGGIECAHAAELSVLSGQDEHSLKLHLDFADAQAGDYALPAEQCAMTGFTNLPADYGVADERLKAKAQKCPLPLIEEYAAEDAACVTINGAQLKDVDTDGEMSAFATAGHTGVRVLDVAFHSQWFAEGLRRDRVILSVNGAPLKSTGDLARMVDAAAPDQKLRLELKSNSGTITCIDITAKVGE